MQIDLNTFAGYNIACAMRGPDPAVGRTRIMVAMWLKAYFTAPIRHMVEISDGHGAWIRSLNQPLTHVYGFDQEMDTLRIQDIFDVATLHYIHYLWHTRTALGAIIAMGIDRPGTQNLLDTCHALLSGKYTAFINAVRESGAFPVVDHEE